MTLLEKKKMVVEWMGWRYIELGGDLVDEIKKHPRDLGFRAQEWEPSVDPSAWPEIWERMDEYKKITYKRKLIEIFKSEGDGEIYWWKFHTAPPVTCWKALVATLSETSK